MNAKMKMNCYYVTIQLLPDYEMSINVQFSDEEIIHKMKMREQADCFEQRWKEACSLIWSYMNYDADENKHLCSLIYWRITEL